MFIVLFKRKVLFNSYLFPFKGKEGAEEIFLYKDKACPFFPINIITYLKLSSFSLHSVFSPWELIREANLGLLLCSYIFQFCVWYEPCVFWGGVFSGQDGRALVGSDPPQCLQPSATPRNLPVTLGPWKSA